MKYVILCYADNVEPFTVPRQLCSVKGETLVGRTVRLLKENGIKDILITSKDKRFMAYAPIYTPMYNDYRPKENKGYWLDAFPVELMTEPVCFLLGDVYYSEEAIRTIVGTETDSVLFYCSYKNTDPRYIKHHDEPFGFKVVDCDTFIYHIEHCKRLYDQGKTGRHPIAWELYRSLNGLDVNKHIMTENYVAINDETCDVDRIIDVDLLNKM